VPDDKPAGSRIVDRSTAAGRAERVEVVAGLLDPLDPEHFRYQISSREITA
jgi:hypothetical protein